MKSRWRDIAIGAAIAGLYFCGANLSFVVPADEMASPLWPPAGIAVAALLVLGSRYWPGVMLGAAFETWLHLSADFGHTATVGLASLSVAAANTLEALTAAWLARRFAGGSQAFEQPQNVLRFVGLAAIPASCISPSLGIATLALCGFEELSAPAWFTWWLGDLVGVIVVTPIILVWAGKALPKFTLKQGAEFVLLAASVVLCGELLFNDWIPGTKGIPLDFLIVPVLLWPALKFGRRGTSLVMCLLALVSVAGTAAGSGPFAVQDGSHSLLILQAYLGVLSILGFVVAADTAQRKAAQVALRESEKRYRDLFQNSPEPVLVYDAESFQILAVNRAAVQQYGFPEEEFLRQRLPDIRVTVGEGSEPSRTDAFSVTARQAQHRKKDGDIIEVEVRTHEMLFDHRRAVMLLATDVTQRNRMARRADAFSKVGERLSAAETPREAAQVVLEAADVLFKWDAFVFDMLLPDQKTVTTVLALDTINGTRSEVRITNSEPGLVERQAIDRGPQLILRTDPGHFPPGTIPFGDKTRPSASLIVVPIKKETRLVGLLSIQSYTPRAYSDEDLRTLEDLADHCGGALDRIRANKQVEVLNQELRRHLEELQIIFNAVPVGIAVCRDPTCRFITGNAACESMFGSLQLNMACSRERRDRPFRILRQGKDVTPEEMPLHLAARRGERIGAEEFEIVYNDGRSILCYASASPLYSDAGGVRGSLGIFLDLTEQKRIEQELVRLNAELERRVQQRTTQLEAINSELEAFSYSVSHDLRAPLRSIRGFSEVLLARYSRQLDARGQEFLKRACESCSHMDRLIDDLLKLSRVGRAELQPQLVDLSAQAQTIIEQLRKAEPRRPVQVTIAPDLKAWGDERLLRLALENLLRNAWKFTRDRPRALIEFGPASEQEPAFCIRDNGVGFDMAYADKLFGVFQRLHTTAEFPGTGVGLATVQRIINRHGGRIWAAAEVDRGASFFFTLPAHEKKRE